MSNTVKVQINSLEALERLIGNDTALEIEIRNNVVDKFEKKYLKGLAAESMSRIQPWMEGLKSSCVKMVETEIGKVRAWASADNIQLTSEFQKQIRETVKKQIEVEVYTATKKLWEERRESIMVEVQAMLRQEVAHLAKKLAADDQTLKEAVRQGVEAMMKKMVAP